MKNIKKLVSVFKFRGMQIFDFFSEIGCSYSTRRSYEKYKDNPIGHRKIVEAEEIKT